MRWLLYCAGCVLGWLCTGCLGAGIAVYCVGCGCVYCVALYSACWVHVWLGVGVAGYWVLGWLFTGLAGYESGCVQCWLCTVVVVCWGGWVQGLLGTYVAQYRGCWVLGWLSTGLAGCCGGWVLGWLCTGLAVYWAGCASVVDVRTCFHMSILVGFDCIGVVLHQLSCLPS